MTQRAGRAGRLEPIRLHLLAKQSRRAAAQSDPGNSAKRSVGAAAGVAAWAAAIRRLRWLDLPPAINLAAARRLADGAIGAGGERLSAHGRQMAALGNDPRLAAMLTAADSADDAATAAKLAAILEERGAAAIRRRVCAPAGQPRQRRSSTAAGQPRRSLQTLRGWRRCWLQPLLTVLPVFDGRRVIMANGMGAMLDADDALGRHEYNCAAATRAVRRPMRELLALPLDIDQLVAQRPELIQRSDTVEGWRRVL